MFIIVDHFFTLSKPFLKLSKNLFPTGVMENTSNINPNAIESNTIYRLVTISTHATTDQIIIYIIENFLNFFISSISVIGLFGLSDGAHLYMQIPHDTATIIVNIIT